MSLSKWIAHLIHQRLADEWSAEVKALPGDWNDFPTLEEIRADMGKDAPRETF